MKILLVFFLALPLVASSQTWMLSGPDVSAGSGSSIEYWIKNDSTNAVGYCNTPLTGGSFVYHFNNGNPDVDYTGNFSAQGFGGSIPAGGSVRIAVMEVASAGYWATANGTVSVQAGSSIASYVATSPASLPTSATAGTVTYHISDIVVLPPPCETNQVITINNNTTHDVDYDFRGADGAIHGGIALAPGQGYSRELRDIPCEWYPLTPVGRVIGSVTATETNVYIGSDSRTNQYFVITTNQLPQDVLVTNNDGTMTVLQPAPTTYNPTNNGSQGGQLPILFTSSATNAAIATQQGSSALYDAITKNGSQAHLDSGDLAGILSNGFQHLGSELGDFTNGGAAITNYAQETTLSNIYAWMTRTNDLSTNTVQSELNAGNAASADGSNSLAGIVASLDHGSADKSSTSLGADTVNWTVNIPYGGGYDIDLNPFHRSWVVAIAAFTRSFVKWALLASMVIYCSRMLVACLAAAGGNQQGRKVAGLGIISQIPVVSAITAISLALAITVAMAIVIGLAVEWFGQYMTTIGTSPFSNVGSISEAVWMADQFLPLATLVACPIASVIFTFLLGAAVFVVQTITRFLVGE